MDDRTQKIISLLILACVLFAGCEPYGGEGYREYAVVESYLIAERGLPVVLLSTTMPLSEEYSFNEAAIAGADVVLYLLDNEGEKTEPGFQYQMDTSSPGIYRPITVPEVTVEPRRSYLLEADLSEHGLLSARTTVPDTFRVTSEVPETLVYREDVLNITISGSTNADRQNVYVFNTIARDPVVANLTPFYRSVIDNNENDIEAYANNSSGLINEGNFQTHPDGSVQLHLPWVGVAFYGENQVVINSLDRNMFDFIRSQEVQLGGSTLSPGEIPNAIYHIEGGIGVFGALSADTLSTRILRPEL
ncbi:MAG: DUF4249 family protein [Balneolaceae bacterium]